MTLELWAEPDPRPQKTGSGTRVHSPVSLNMGPLTVECIYMFYFVTCFYLSAFHLILFPWNKHLLQCVDRESTFWLWLYALTMNWAGCLVRLVPVETHCCRCTEACFQAVNANVLTSHVISWWECIYCISVCFCDWPHDLSLSRWICFVFSFWNSKYLFRSHISVGLVRFGLDTQPVYSAFSGLKSTLPPTT